MLLEPDEGLRPSCTDLSNLIQEQVDTRAVFICISTGLLKRLAPDMATQLASICSAKDVYKHMMLAS